jgi:hypothetical protein
MRLTPPSKGEKIKIQRLKRDFEELPLVEENVDSEAEKAWNQFLNRLKYDVKTKDPRRFLSWDVVRETMFVGNADYINTELAYLKSNNQWSTKWRDAIKEVSNGSPYPFYRYMSSSGNLIHHAYHLAFFEEKTGIKIEDLEVIFEFGGGYGSMCRLAHRLGFRGRYVIFDLPHFSLLQRYYLDSLGLTVKDSTNPCEKSGIFCINSVEDLRRLCVGGDNSLFIATWSLSESPLSIREQVLPEVSLCKSHLVAYQDIFGEVDNVAYFENQSEFKLQPNIVNQKISHLKGSRYLFSSGN